MKPQQYITFLIVLITAISACSSGTVEREGSYPNEDLLINATELHTLSEESTILLIDAREETDGSLIPNAIHFPALSSLVDTTHPVSSYLTGPAAFQEMMRGAGLNNGDRVVIYDDGNGLAAARLFYALEYYGFPNASILNGGIQGWRAENLPVSDTPRTPEPGRFEVRTEETRMCSFEEIMAAIDDPGKIIFDTRSDGEYRGEVERAERSGHIPNAVHLEWSMVLQQEGIPYFLPADEIQEKYNALGLTRDKEIIPHCQSNVRGSHAYFTLRLMGYDSIRPYEGSWAEYGNRSDARISRP